MIVVNYTGQSQNIAGTSQPVNQVNSVAGPGIVIDVTLMETDTVLPYKYVSAALDWNDGTAPVVYPKHAGAIRVNATRALNSGTYYIKLAVTNYKQPYPDSTYVMFVANIAPFPSKPTPNPIIFGPILPRDAGYPNAQQWELDRSTDTVVLASSIKMLLLTNKGERICNSGYGTTIRRLLFGFNIPENRSLIQSEVTQAIQLWEPRVTVNSVSVVPGSDDRSVVATVFVTSKLTKLPFSVSVSLAP